MQLHIAAGILITVGLMLVVRMVLEVRIGTSSGFEHARATLLFAYLSLLISAVLLRLSGIITSDWLFLAIDIGLCSAFMRYYGHIAALHRSYREAMYREIKRALWGTGAR